MSIATICLAVACVLPILCAGLAKRAGVMNRTFDNDNPREWLAKQTGAAARANAAQANSWEALIVFAAGVLSAQVQEGPAGTIDTLALVFVLARVIYIGLYVADLATLRSVVWTVGFVASLALFFVRLV
jgi:uncharacterized MAPEG superfamily protein